VKDPALPDTMYVTELVGPNTVNTMPEKTLAAVADHGQVSGDTVSDTSAAAQEVFDAISAVGVDLTDVFRTIEAEGVKKFIASWSELADTVQGQLDAVTRRTREYRTMPPVPQRAESWFSTRPSSRGRRSKGHRSGERVRDPTYRGAPTPAA